MAGLEDPARLRAARKPVLPVLAEVTSPPRRMTATGSGAYSHLMVCADG